MDILNLPEHIRILEELLLHQDFSSSPEQLEKMLSDDFWEIDRNGKMVEREAVIRWIMGKNPASRWEFTGFEVRQLADNLVLATYLARQIIPEEASIGGARHCSLWRENGPGKTWQLVFHQTTKTG